MLRLVTLCQWSRIRVLINPRLLASFTTLGLLSACAVQPQIAPTQEAAQYQSRAGRHYAVPGTPDDPWGPYIEEASARFDVPTRWIRQVMRVESGGLEYQNGQLTTSSAGAMGLMQVMPETYDEMRARYGLGEDPYDPHNNVLAGTAYLREMYDAYGIPGFLAAYNAGPARLEDYLNRHHPLPDETRHYVAMIGPNIAGIYPINRSPSEQLALNQMPVAIPPGPRRGSVAYAQATPSRAASPTPRAIQMAELPKPPAMSPPPGYLALPPEPPRTQVAMAVAPPPRSQGFHLIAPAAADTLPMHRGGVPGVRWAIQVGAFASEGQALAAAETARAEAPATLNQSRPMVGPVRQGHAMLYRARLVGLSRDAAVQACEKLGHSRTACTILSPDTQS
jgi:hypothetical protein